MTKQYGKEHGKGHGRVGNTSESAGGMPAAGGTSLCGSGFQFP